MAEHRTRAIGARDVDEENLAALAGIVAGLARRGDVIALSGDLGMGKTSFARAFIRARAGEAIDVPSPTFTLVQVYEAGDTPVWHFDLYRLVHPEEIVELGFEEAIGTGVALLEWPEILAGKLPPDRLDVRLTPGTGAQLRRIEFSGHGTWAARLALLAAKIGEKADP